MCSKPSILICNDDGIFSPGLHFLAEIALEYGEVTVVAPYKERSGKSHSVTMYKPVRAYDVKVTSKIKGHAISGTPTDAVKYACSVINKNYDLVLSGINYGRNVGMGCIYSGTVGAAAEGFFKGITSLAISHISNDPNTDLSSCIPICKKIISYALNLPSNNPMFFNINIPKTVTKGIKWSKMADSYYQEKFIKRQDPRGNDYYWITGKNILKGSIKNTDIEAIKNGYVSITPMLYDLTNYNFLKDVKNIDL